jgi:hypothetical protein
MVRYDDERKIAVSVIFVLPELRVVELGELASPAPSYTHVVGRFAKNTVPTNGIGTSRGRGPTTRPVSVR